MDENFSQIHSNFSVLYHGATLFIKYILSIKELVKITIKLISPSFPYETFLHKHELCDSFFFIYKYIKLEKSHEKANVTKVMQIFQCNNF